MAADEAPGTVPAQGGDGSSSDIELTIEDVEKIGHATAALTDHTQIARDKLTDALGGGDFSSRPSAQELYRQHTAVVEVFDKTLTAMTTDIENFGSTIIQAAHNHEQTDADVLATLTVIASKVTPDFLHNANGDARNQAGHQLHERDADLDSAGEIDSFGNEHDEVEDASLETLAPEVTAPAPDETGSAAGAGHPGGGYDLSGPEPQ